MMDDFEKTPDPDGLQPRLPAGVDRAEFQNGAIQFERPDWTLFRTVATLSQKAGVPQRHLRRLVLKELVDNALDAGAGFVGVGPLAKDRYFVQDDGPGLDGSPQEIARLFSINRPLVSTKLLRLPRRGALGNGLRVVAGAVAASQGRIEVWTRRQHLVLKPQDDGGAAVEVRSRPTSTRARAIEITLGPALPDDPHALAWAHEAIAMARGGEGYGGRSSPWWCDGEQFFEALQAAGNRPVRDLIAALDGCSGAKAGQIAAAFKNTPCKALSRDQAVHLLQAARAKAKPVQPKRLGRGGRAGDSAALLRDRARHLHDRRSRAAGRDPVRGRSLDLHRTGGAAGTRACGCSSIAPPSPGRSTPTWRRRASASTAAASRSRSPPSAGRSTWSSTSPRPTARSPRTAKSRTCGSFDDADRRRRPTRPQQGAPGRSQDE